MLCGAEEMIGEFDSMLLGGDGVAIRHVFHYIGWCGSCRVASCVLIGGAIELMSSVGVSSAGDANLGRA